MVAGKVVGVSCTSGLREGDGTVERCSSLVSLVTTFVYRSSVNRFHIGTRNGYRLRRLGLCPCVTPLRRFPVFLFPDPTVWVSLQAFRPPSCRMGPSMAVSRSGSQPGARDRTVESLYAQNENIRSTSSTHLSHGGRIGVSGNGSGEYRPQEGGEAWAI